MTLDARVRTLVGFSLLAAIATFVFVGPIEQPLGYHDFADGNRHLSIPNFANVASNLAYLVPGLMGLYLVHEVFGNRETFTDPREALPFYLVFSGGVLIAFGSGFYHLHPDNMTLVADRLTMIAGFIGVLSFVIAERISVRWGLKLLPVFLALGFFSVIYWIYTEMQSAGDLRLYGLVQFLPLVAIPVMLFFFPARYNGAKYVWLTLASYAIAKLFEQFDAAIWEMTRHIVSGHTLKHLISGLGIYILVLYLRERRALPGAG